MNEPILSETIIWDTKEEIETSPSVSKEMTSKKADLTQDRGPTLNTKQQEMEEMIFKTKICGEIRMRVSYFENLKPQTTARAICNMKINSLTVT